jgi:deoxyribose-phosphate aldolase
MSDVPDDLPCVAAVCVYPSMVAECAAALTRMGARGGAKGGARGGAGSNHVRIASVATGFPSGQFPLDVRLDDTRRAIRDGADEIDMVISRGAFLAGKLSVVADEISAVKRVCVEEGHRRGAEGGDQRVALKVILETGELETLDNVRRASDLAIRAMHEARDTGEPKGHAGDKSPVVDFIKTSTGKVTPAATMPVTLVMLEAVRDWYLKTGLVVGVKPAGGIRTAKQAIHYMVMVRETLGGLQGPGLDARGWLRPEYWRFGASALANDILRQMAFLKTGSYRAGYDVTES